MNLHINVSFFEEWGGRAACQNRHNSFQSSLSNNVVDVTANESNGFEILLNLTIKTRNI